MSSAAPTEPRGGDGAAAAGRSASASGPAPRHTFTFLGTGAGCGVPAFFCDCPACEEARANPAARRGDCGVMVTGTQRTLIDTPPDLRHQLLRENVRRIDELVYTHAHYDHLGGLGELEYLVQLVTKRNLPVHGSAETLAGVAREYHYLTYCLDLREQEPFEPFELDGARYTPLPVTHAPGTFGYLIETPATRLFYASDTGRLPDATAERVRGADIVIMDATFWKRNWSPENHHSVQETIEEGLGRLDAGTLYLTHLAMHYDEPITLAELEEYLGQYEGRVRVAADGLSFPI